MAEWQPYLASLVNGPITGGGLFGKNTSTWVASPNCQLSQENIKQLTKFLENADDGQGILINGDKYINTTSPEEKGKHVKLTGPVNREGPKSLLYCEPCEQGLVVAFTNTDKVNQAALCANVHSIASHLCNSGY